MSDMSGLADREAVQASIFAEIDTRAVFLHADTAHAAKQQKQIALGRAQRNDERIATPFPGRKRSKLKQMSNDHDPVGRRLFREGELCVLPGRRQWMQLDHNDPRWAEYARRSPTLRRMLQMGYPLTRETWLNLNYGAKEPGPHDAWTHEQEEEVPEPLRDWSKLREATPRR